MTSAQLTLIARLNPSALDSRRGVVRLHPEVLDALGLRAWEAVALTGARTTSALAAPSTGEISDALVDDVTLSNLRLAEGKRVEVTVTGVRQARTVTVAGSRLARASLNPHTLRLALIGKVITAGDAVSLLPQDLAPPSEADVLAARTGLARALGGTWTSELLTITATEPAGTVAVGASTAVRWYDDSSAETATTAPATDRGEEGTSTLHAKPETPQQHAAPPIADLIGAKEVAHTLTEWLDLSRNHPELLHRLGASGGLGVLLSGPEGVGKATLVRAVGRAEDIAVTRIAAGELAATDPNTALTQLRELTGQAGDHGIVLLTDIDALLPASGAPAVATEILRVLREALRDTPSRAVVATTAHPESVDPRLRAPEVLERELALPMPDAKVRTELLRVLLRDIPLEPDVDLAKIAERTPGFVAADLIALRRDAALRAALRERGEAEPRVAEQDLVGAAETVRPASMSTSETLSTGGVTLSDVGDMVEAKQALTETVLWPLRYPDSFERLGIAPPKGVLLHGPPGTGKTFLVRALAGAGALNVFTVKGAELMDKWVGESERAVRELFKRAADAAPALIFLDEVDALAPARGQSSDSGVSDRVVAALLTELDGMRPVRAVVVLAATNRPELVDPALLRPGRLERKIEVPLPDAAARAEILRTSARNTPLAADVDLAAIAETLHGYSAADCAGLLREAALTAMRESLDATQVTAEHLNQAR